MKLKLTLIASAAYFAITLSAYALSASSETNGVPGGTISTPGSESKANQLFRHRAGSSKAGVAIGAGSTACRLGVVILIVIRILATSPT
jgi:hypothetical protein